jgi:hypothetical protein
MKAYLTAVGDAKVATGAPLAAATFSSSRDFTLSWLINYGTQDELLEVAVNR